MTDGMETLETINHSSVAPHFRSIKIRQFLNLNRVLQKIPSRNVVEEFGRLLSGGLRVTFDEKAPS